MMPTDEERREVARRLRAAKGPSLMVLMGVLGVGGEGVFARLADLIEPSEPKVKCAAEVKFDGERLEQLAYDAAVELTGIDRDALLALADEMQCDGADAMDDDEWCKPLLYEYAARIREYLGVADA